MGKFLKGEGGYWLGKKRTTKSHSRHYFNCVRCNKEFWRSDYAYKKGLENPKMMPKYCSRDCQLKENKFRVGKPPNQTAFKKNDPRITGEKNSNWKGGISPLAEKIRRIVPYIEWRTKVYVKDDYTCQSCGKRGGRLNADHYPLMFHKLMEIHTIKSVQQARDCPDFWNVDNGQTLCIDCHKKKTVGELDHVYKSKERMRGLNRKGGTIGRKWKRKAV